jgi:large subunit ribosomal protein L13
MKKFTTPVPKVANRRWHLIDAQGQVLGRLATQVASLLMGKNDPDFSYHQDRGDYVVVINAAEIKVTGDKTKTKMYHHYSGFPGGLKSLSLGQLMERDPSLAITHAVAGMIPKNKLRDTRLTRLKIFAGSDHPYADKLNA